eukprot:1175793-Prorocentrum_minimum.AAC.2
MAGMDDRVDSMISRSGPDTDPSFQALIDETVPTENFHFSLFIHRFCAGADVCPCQTPRQLHPQARALGRARAEGHLRSGGAARVLAGEPQPHRGRRHEPRLLLPRRPQPRLPRDLLRDAGPAGGVHARLHLHERLERPPQGAPARNKSRVPLSSALLAAHQQGIHIPNR